MAVSLLHAVFGATLTYVIDTNYSDIELFFGLLVGSTALGGALTALRNAWEPFLAGWFGRQTDGAKGRLPLFMLSLAGAAVGYALIPWELPLGIWVPVVVFVMATGTALGTIMDAMAADAARATSVIPAMTAYSVSTDLGAALGPAFVFWAVGAEFGLFFAYLACAFVFALIASWYWKEFRGFHKSRMN